MPGSGSVWNSVPVEEALLALYVPLGITLIAETGATELSIKVLKAFQNIRKIVTYFGDQRRVITRNAQILMVSVLVKNFNDSLHFLFKHIAFFQNTLW
jgi:hypothetical protein